MWNELSDELKAKFKEYCDQKFGKTCCFCETGEPMYFDEEYNIYDNTIIINLLFKTNIN